MNIQPTDTTFPDELLPAVKGLLEQAGKRGDFQLQPLPKGANNRVYRVCLPDDEALLKWYFSDAEDRRDRLRTEWDFAQFVWRGGLRQLAEPLCCDSQQGLGLYEFLPGRPMTADEIEAGHVQQAANFCRAMNAVANRAEAQPLPDASEACFSLGAHLKCVSTRVERLSLAVNEGVSPAAQTLVRQRLVPRWGQVESDILAAAEANGVDLQEKLPREDRILSPSDFGFHNALLDNVGTLRFFDFEYAGWDDPAKTICDFFCQVETPVPKQFLECFTAGIAGELAEPSRLKQRTQWLTPAYSVKWCCIVLNPLLAVGERRRAFSSAEPEEETLWLDRASRLLDDKVFE